ncbi:MAG: biotin--[acetyl-CoA-carboxylase] ligase [Puniceicoccales bacterium]|jgi:BirA family biotin operon repressor/biotin-[acetyl-CoA-carboxylase] ligase|nr:biotin--[acetyl-CoA-carboxylase] ligase [Puniceicoccales bacterium]
MDNGKIFDAFLDADGAPVSGSALARTLGISRVSVWERLQQLRRQGVVFDAAPHVGYRLVPCLTHAHGGLITAWLRRIGTACIPIHHLNAVDSTNDETARRLSAGEQTPFVVISSIQTNGRGRMGRVWQSRDAGNLYMSFAFRPQLAPAQMASVTLATGLRLCARFSTPPALPLQVKWPNDLMCAERKIAGILTEAHVDADCLRDMIIGIGINVNGRRDDFPPELRDSVGSLSEAHGAPLDINKTAATTIATVLETVANFVREGLGTDFDALWRQHDFLAGKTVSARSAGHEITGVALGISATGALRVRDASGKIHTLNSGEATLHRK